MKTTTAIKLFSKDKRTIIDILRKAEHIVDNKLDKEYAYFNQKRVLPEGINIAGIDATQGGENLTAEEHRRYEQKVLSLNKQRLVLRNALAKWDCLVLPQNVFEELRLKMGLLSIYRSETEWHQVSESWSEHQSKLESQLKKARDEKQQYPLVDDLMLSLFIPFLPAGLFNILVFILILYFPEHSSTLMITDLVVFVMIFRFTYKKCERNFQMKNDILIANLEDQISKWNNNFSELFLELKAKPVTSQSMKPKPSYSPIFYKSTYIARIALPQPPPSVLDSIIEIYSHLHRKGIFEIVTLADPKAVGLEIKEIKRKKPEPVRSVRNEDPAIFVEYGEYVALLPQTFYNLSNLELDFICEVMDVATHWDARGYIFN